MADHHLGMNRSYTLIEVEPGERVHVTSRGNTPGTVFRVVLSPSPDFGCSPCALMQLRPGWEGVCNSVRCISKKLKVGLKLVVDDENI